MSHWPGKDGTPQGGPESPEHQDTKRPDLHPPVLPPPGERAGWLEEEDPDVGEVIHIAQGEWRGGEDGAPTPDDEMLSRARPQ